MEYKGIKHNSVNLFFNYYHSETRQHEIDLALENNKKVFDRVVIIKGRPTFNELFKYSELYPNDINCFCNSDIYFENIDYLRQIKENECYAITRQDLLNTQYAPGSQDAWVFKGIIENINAEFCMGMWGCDNRLAHEIKMAGYNVINPAYSVKLIHLHEEDNRNYKRTKDNTVPPPYLTIQPT
jgi:hypothetical protein